MYFSMRLLTVLSLASTAALVGAIPAPQDNNNNGHSGHNGHHHPSSSDAIAHPNPSTPPSDSFNGPIPIDSSHVRAIMSNPNPNPDSNSNSNSNSTNHLTARSVPLGMYQCDKPGYKGTCMWDAPVDDGKCHKSLYGATASMGPDKGLRCTVYKNPTCGGTGNYPMNYPGIFNFAMDIWWKACSCTGQASCLDAPQSYKCTSSS